MTVHSDGLALGSHMQVYIDQIEGYYSAILGPVYAITSSSAIYATILTILHVEWYLSFPWQSRRISTFPGFVYVLYSSDQEEGHDV